MKSAAVPHSEPGTRLSSLLAPGTASWLLEMTRENTPRLLPRNSAERTALTWLPACDVAPGSCAVQRPAPLPPTSS